MNHFLIQQGVLKQYTGSDETVTVPDGVREIGYGAFRGCSALRRVVLPEGVDRVGSMAFAGCAELRQISLPPGVAQIGYSAFEQCVQLTAVQLPEGLALLDRMAFAGCTALAEIDFPDSLRIVGRDALRDTAWLAAQPDGVVYAGRLALFGKGTVTQAALRAGTVKICADAFRNCSALTAVTLPDSLQEIGDRAFQNCRRLAQIEIPPQVTAIGDKAFDECSKLRAVLHCSQVALGRGCFADGAAVRVTGMDLAQLPANVRQSAILSFADDVCNGAALAADFYRCSLRYIQSRRKLLYPLALEHWNLLQLMLQTAMIPLEDADGILDSILAGEQAEAAAALLQYKQTLTAEAAASTLDSWDDLELSWELPAVEKTAASLEREWGLKKLRDGTYTILLYRGQEADVTVPSQIGTRQITAIAPAACSPERYGIKRETADQRRRMRTVTIEEGILKIGNHAFAGCADLRQVTLPESVTEIGYEAFRGCGRLTEINIPPSVARIERGAFADCTSLTAVHLPDGVQLADDAFARCPAAPTA